MAYLVHNGNKTDYYDVDGNSITSTTQPDVNSGAVKGVTTASLDSTKFIGVDPGDPLHMLSSVFQESTGWGTTGVRSGGTCGYQAAGEYVILGDTISLNGGSNTAFCSPGIRRSNQNKSLHPLAALRTRKVCTALRAGYWNNYTGTWSTAPTTGNDFSDMGSDDAAAPTVAVPGELTYMYGFTRPATGEYSSKSSA